MSPALVEAHGLVKHFPLGRSLADAISRKPGEVIHAVDGVSLEINDGETLGLIGESGSGKTTLGWLLAKLHVPTAGRIRFAGQDITDLTGRDLLAWRRNVQVVFQDPVGSLDPRLRVWQIVGEPIQAQEHLSRAELKSRVAEILPRVGLPGGSLDQYPHEFSGGGRQRLSLARALSVRPKLLILDEPTSALDVAVQAQVLNIAALPAPDPRRRRARYRISGEVPTLVHPPPGCRFAPRCPFVIDRCRLEAPTLRAIPGRPEQLVACHRAEEVEDVPPEQLLTGIALAVGGP
ncbi:MAG: ATP-binding cassette domain-containing protein [Nitrospirae bacterium]|nr:MAG: ATP-binding cassette domain-containing protein [Nitrospirota bacterium]